MKRLIILLVIFLTFSGIDSFAQKISGVGGELSILSFKVNYRNWVSRPNGFEVFGGIAADINNNIEPNDFEAGVKYIHALIYERTERTYIGVMGKWKWVDAFDSNRRTSLPVPGILIGKEWLDKRMRLKGFAVELGYQYGWKRYFVADPTGVRPGEVTFEEFPLILNLRYSFYTKRK